MGRRGWGGRPPDDDDDARKRIVDAAIRCIERSGPARVTLSDVATELAVTRRTVYRYFGTTEELFTAVSQFAFAGWVSRVQALAKDTDDVAEMLVEVVAFIIEQLPGEPLLTLLLASDRTAVFSRQMVQPDAIARGRIILQHTNIGWSELGHDDHDLDDLVEFLFRIIQSMVIAPSEPPRSPSELRAFLRRWIGPAVSPPANRPASGQRRRSAGSAAR